MRYYSRFMLAQFQHAAISMAHYHLTQRERERESPSTARNQNDISLRGAPLFMCSDSATNSKPHTRSTAYRLMVALGLRLRTPPTRHDGFWDGVFINDHRARIATTMAWHDRSIQHNRFLLIAATTTTPTIGIVIGAAAAAAVAATHQSVLEYDHRKA